MGFKFFFFLGGGGGVEGFGGVCQTLKVTQIDVFNGDSSGSNPSLGIGMYV